MDRKHLTEGETSRIAAIVASLIHICSVAASDVLLDNSEETAEAGQRFPQRTTEETPELLDVTGPAFVAGWIVFGVMVRAD